MSTTTPFDHPNIFGQHFGKRNSEPILTLGKIRYTRYDLGLIGCPHTMAARELDRVLKQLNIASLEDLIEHYGPKDFISIKGFGTTAFYVLTCILRDSNVNLRRFYTADVTVDTLKAQAVKEQEASNGNRRKRSKR